MKVSSLKIFNKFSSEFQKDLSGKLVTLQYVSCRRQHSVGLKILITFLSSLHNAVPPNESQFRFHGYHLSLSTSLY